MDSETWRCTEERCSWPLPRLLPLSTHFDKEPRREGKGVKIGGLFGEEIKKGSGVLPWSRAQQAAFLIRVWQEVKTAVAEWNQGWAETLRENAQDTSTDPAFSGRHSLLATDQGVRAILQVTNDLCFVRAENLRLDSWQHESSSETIDLGEISSALRLLDREQTIVVFLGKVAQQLAKFDWRTSAAPGLDDDQKRMQMAYKGSGGYKELRRRLLHLVASSEDSDLRTASTIVLKELKY